jgi:CheY-like chemotaxis protein
MNACTVVLIEDNPADVYLVQLALKENHVNCQLTTFSNGQEALKVLCPPILSQTDRTPPNVILLDLNTPKSDGFEILIQLKGTPHLVNVPVAILTSSAATSDKTRSERLGAVRFIQKPSGLSEFLSTVGEAVREMLGDQHLAETPTTECGTNGGS